MRLLIPFIALLLSIPGQAGILYLSFGPSVDEPIASSKMLSLQYELTHGIPSLTLEGGAYSDPGIDPTEFGGANAGLHIVTENGLTTRIGMGPILISKTDDRLSSAFELHIQARVGLDLKSWESGLQFDHFSNAGIVPPNMGKDVISLYVGIPL